jgi:hypothetical protein
MVPIFKYLNMLSIKQAIKLRHKTIIIPFSIVIILSSLVLATAQTTNSTATPEPSLIPTPTPEPTYDVGIQVINNSVAMKQAIVAIDNKPENTGFTGKADFKLTAGLHHIQIYVNNIAYYNSSLAVTQSQVIKIDITEYLPQATVNPTEVGNLSDENSNSVFASFGLVIIAITGVLITVILLKRRQN